MIYAQTTLMRMQKQMRIYKPVSWLPSINAYQWNSAYYELDSSHLENLLKYIFEMGVNRKFDFRRIWKFCWGLSNVISGGNWLFRWVCVYSGGTLYSSVNYELTWHVYSIYMYILSTFYLKKNKGGRGCKQISTYKTCYEIKKIFTSPLSVERGVGEGGEVQFLQKK